MTSMCLASWRGAGATVELSTDEWPTPTERTARTSDHKLLFFMPPVAFRGQTRFLDGSFHEFIDVGRIMFLPAGRLLESHGTGGKTQSLRCSLSPDRIDGWVGAVDLPRAVLERALKLDRSPLGPILDRIAQEIRTPGLGSDLYIDSLVTVGTIELLRALRAEAEAPACPGLLSARQIERVRERIEASSLPIVTVRELAALCGLSDRHFMRLFKRTTGSTVAEHVRSSQLERARQLLAATDLPLKEIAFRLGFETHSAFSAAYRRLTGEPPTAYRRGARGPLFACTATRARLH